MSQVTLNTLPSYSEETKRAVAIATTTLAIVGIAALVIGVLGSSEVLTGINAMTQWSMVGVGGGLIVAGLAVSGVCFHSIIRSAQDFGIVTEETIKKTLDAIISEGKDPLEAAHMLAEMIPLEELEAIVREKYRNFPDALTSAKNMFKQAQYYVETRETLSPSIQTRLWSIFDTLLNVIDSLLLALGIADFFQPPENDFHAEFKLQKIMMLISLFTLLTATMLPMLGITTGASVVGGIMLFIALLSILWPYIRPLPSELPEAKNWSKDIREGKLLTTEGRAGAIEEIRDLLNNNQTPLLVGPSGIGKTQTAQAFARALERGELPEFLGKTVFYFNTADLVNSKEPLGGNNKILKKILKKIEGRRNQCILVLDEIHLAYQAKEESAIGEQLKTLLDEKNPLIAENNLLVIGLTTEEEYATNIFAAQRAGDRRFKTVTIATTNEEATEAILKQVLVQNSPGVMIAPDAIPHLVQQTKKEPQPLTARDLLMSCAQTATKRPPSQVSHQVEKARMNLHSNYLGDALLGSAGLEAEDQQNDTPQNLENTVAKLERNLEKEREDFYHLAQTGKQLAAAREAKFRSALNVSQYSRENLSSDQRRELTEFLLQKYFLEGALETQLTSQAKRLKVNVVIDKPMIDQAIATRQEALKAKLAAVARGRDDFAARQEN